jgi:hypothetical protein
MDVFENSGVGNWREEYAKEKGEPNCQVLRWKNLDTISIRRYRHRIKEKRHNMIE